MDFCSSLSSKKSLLAIIKASSARRRKLAVNSSTVSGILDFCDVYPQKSTPTKHVSRELSPANPSVELNESLKIACGCTPASYLGPCFLANSDTFSSYPTKLSENELAKDYIHSVSTPRDSKANCRTPSDEDDGFEDFLGRLRQTSPVSKDSEKSTNSFLKDSSDSSSLENATDPAFYYRIDNSCRSSLRNRNRSGIANPAYSLPTQHSPGRSNYPTPLRFSSPSSADENVYASKCNSSPRTPLRPISQNFQQPISEFVYSLYPTEETGRNQHSHTLRHPSAERFVKHFKKNRVELANRLFHIFNATVFQRRLPDDLPIIWNSRLFKTAGQCKYLRREVTSSTGEKTVTRLAQIELSIKVCTSAERVRDTLLHESCHAAVWLLDGCNDGHGPRWRHWASRAMRVWPRLPMVSVCHAYTIDTRFTYRCTGCGACVNRHSKSIDTSKQICARCHSRFELLLNTPRGRSACSSVPSGTDNRSPTRQSGRSTSTPPSQTQVTRATDRRTPAFAEFVRANYKRVRQQPDVKTHGNAMAELGFLFKSMKVSESIPDRTAAMAAATTTTSDPSLV